MLHLLKEEVLSVCGLEMDPEKFYIDFDQASAIAINKIFPKANIMYCYIHMYRAFKKKAIKLCKKKNGIECALEFSKFWNKTIDLSTLDSNVKVNFHLFISPTIHINQKKDPSTQSVRHMW